MTPEIQKSILRACGRFIRKTLEPIEKRLADMENKSMESEVTAIVSKLLTSNDSRSIFCMATNEAVAKHFEANPVRDGKDAEPIEISDVVAELLVAPEIKTLVDLHVAEAVEALPKPENGKDADPVSDEQISKFVESYLQANPPAPGKDGTNVTADDVRGVVELEVMKGLRDLERHAGEVIQRAADAIPKPKDGADGQDLTGAELDYDGERGLIIRHNGGEIVKRMPIPIDRGYWRPGMKSEKGDVVTESGSAWIALADNDVKPSLETKEFWRMMARKGKDGERGEKGVPYVPPAPVKLGNGNG